MPEKGSDMACFDCQHCMGAARLAGRLCIRCELADCSPDWDAVESITFCGRDESVAEAQQMIRDVLPPEENLSDDEE